MRVIRQGRYFFIVPLLCVVVGLTCFVTTRPRVDSHIYTLAQVRNGVIHHPTAWAGRIVLVRGRIVQASWLSRSGWPGNAPINSACLQAQTTDCAAPIPNDCLPVATASCTTPQALGLYPGVAIHLLLVSKTYPQGPGPMLLVSPSQANPLFEIAHHIPLLATHAPTSTGSVGSGSSLSSTASATELFPMQANGHSVVASRVQYYL